MLPDLFISYAQSMEDVMLWRALRDVGPGFYIDVGAADPDRLSVTRAFYERGWRGLNVEPLPEQAERLRRARPRDVVVQAALSDAAGAATFYRVELLDDVGLSTLDRAGAERSGGRVETLEVALTTLAALCREHVTGEVHFLKIDVEGAEAAVLRGADFTATRPWIVLVEATAPFTGEPIGAEWQHLLERAGYVFVWFDGLNRFYVAQERHAALARHFQVQPNPFDHYVVADLLLEEKLEAARHLAQARLNQIDALEAELARLRPPPAPEAAAMPSPPPSKRAPLAYRLVRPIVSPIARRLKMFLVGELRDRLLELAAQQAALRHDVAAIRDRPALDAELAGAVERLLQTLTRERAKD